MADRNIVSAGLKYGFIGFLDSFGVLTGKTPTPPINGSSVNGGMARILGIQHAPTTVPTPNTVQVIWDDDAFAEFLFDNTSTRGFLVDVAIQDLTTWAAILDEQVENYAGMNMINLDRSNAPQYDMCAVFQARAKQERASNVGVKAWGGEFVPLLNCVPLGRQDFQGRTGAAYRLYVVPQLTAHNPWGTTLLDVNNAPMSARNRHFDSDYPVTMHAMGGDGTVTAMAVDYQPASVAQSAVASVVSGGARSGIPVSSVNTAGKIINLSSAPVISSRAVGVYQFVGE